MAEVLGDEGDRTKGQVTSFGYAHLTRCPTSIGVKATPSPHSGYALMATATFVNPRTKSLISI